VIDDGYRSPELYLLTAHKVALKNGTKARQNLFNLEKMPHSNGTSIDLGLLNINNQERELIFDKADGYKASFLGFYQASSSIKADRFIYLQELLGKVMLDNGFNYGTKNEIWHFDFVEL
jgi:D-alanyl-D-alanine dipeptidase